MSCLRGLQGWVRVTFSFWSGVQIPLWGLVLPFLLLTHFTQVHLSKSDRHATSTWCSSVLCAKDGVSSMVFLGFSLSLLDGASIFYSTLQGWSFPTNKLFLFCWLGRFWFWFSSSYRRGDATNNRKFLTKLGKLLYSLIISVKHLFDYEKSIGDSRIRDIYHIRERDFTLPKPTRSTSYCSTMDYRSFRGAWNSYGL